MTPGSAAPVVSPLAFDPLGRMALLCDPGTVQPLEPRESDQPVGVVAAAGRIDGRQVICYAQDSGIVGGSVGTAEADVVVRALRLAHERSLPLVAFLESAGARLHEGAAALGGFSRIFFENVRLSRRAPQISVITGLSAGGGCYSPALTDFVVMTRPSAMFLTGPRVVREAIGEEISVEALGGPTVHNRNGVCQFVVDDDHAAATLVRDLLGYLAPALEGPGETPADPDAPDPGRHLPTSPRKVYDVRDVVRDVVDDGSFLEVSPRWARNMVVGFARLGGRRIGVVANQPRYLAGVIDVAASEKAARFVRTCDRFRLPLVVLVDTPGFMPGSGQEAAGIIRHGAELVRAFASATVPRVSVVLRRAFGGAYITMNSKDLGADVCFAWPGAQIGIMAGHAAVRIVHRRRLAEAHDPKRTADELASEYEAGHVAVERALEAGVVDEVISPAATRARLRRALAPAR
jgi:acetyl-CoA carboxylase carboxyltransferase component